MPERPIYLDHHATTPVDPRVLEAMLPHFSARFGNAASTHHAFGREAADAVDRARGEVAQLIGADGESEIVFTSGATEANNLAILGTVGPGPEGGHLVSTAVEHPSVLAPLRNLARHGRHSLLLVAPEADGSIRPEAVAAALNARTTFVSVMHANNEIGAVNPIDRIGEICRDREILFHSDASQSVGKIRIEVRAQAIDVLSLTAHKFHGPKGIGALFIRGGVRVRAQILGGGQEGGRRSGTLAVPLIVGLGEAARIARREMDLEARRLAALRDRLFRAIETRLGGAGIRLNGPTGPARLPNNLHLSFAGIDGQALLMNLRGLAVSSGSACSSGEPGPSHVLRAIGLDERLAAASLRFGLGRFTTAEEVDEAAEIVARAVDRLRGPTCDPPAGA